MCVYARLHARTLTPLDLFSAPDTGNVDASYIQRERDTHTQIDGEREGAIRFIVGGGYWQWQCLVYTKGERHTYRERGREREREREYLGAIFGGGYCHGVHGRR